MHDIVATIEELGGLHDCTILRVEFMPGDQAADFHIKDIYWNFEGLESYLGPKPGILRFNGISSMSIDGEPNDWIFAVNISRNDAGFSTSIQLNSGDRFEIASASVDLVRDTA